MWSGQAGGLAKAMGAEEFTRKLAAEALRRLQELGRKQGGG